MVKTNHSISDWWQSFEKYPAYTWAFSIFWLILINFIVFLWQLGSTGLVDETEPLFAEASRQMSVTGNWITPYFNEVTRFDKPPLVYWLIAFFYQVIGVNEWAVRLPSALAAIGLVVFSFFTLRNFGFASPAVATAIEHSGKIQRQLWFSAWIGSALVALNLETLLWARQGVSDMLLSGCMGMALLCFFWGYVGKRQEAIPPTPLKKGGGKRQKLTLKSLLYITNKWYLGFYTFAGLAVLTKGPIGVVLPVLVILAFLIYVGSLRETLQEIGVITGGFIFLLITVPWFVLVILQNGQAYIDSFFGYHNLERFTSVVNGHAAPWYFYFLIILGMFAPWSIYLPLSIGRLRFWQRSFWQQQPRSAQFSLFAFFWFAVIFIFFTVAVTKLPSYVLPLMPAAAYLVAFIWSEELSRDRLPSKLNYGLLISIVINIFLLILLSVASLQLPKLAGTDSAMENLSILLQQSHLPWRGSLLWGLTATISILLLIKRQQWRWIIVANIVGFLAFIIFFVSPVFLLVDQVRQLPLRQVAEEIKQVRHSDEALVMIGFKKPSMTFYTQQTFGYFWTIDQDAREFLESIPNEPAYPSTILLLGEPSQIAETGLQPNEYQVLVSRNPYQLVRVERKTVLRGNR